MANWRVGSARLWVALSVAWVIGWGAFFIRLAAFEALLVRGMVGVLTRRAGYGAAPTGSLVAGL